VYGKLDQHGKPYFLLSSLGTDGGTYVHVTQSKRKGLQGEVALWQIEPFVDEPAIDSDAMAELIFRELEKKGLTKE
jgi:hypothetical protein